MAEQNPVFVTPQNVSPVNASPVGVTAGQGTALPGSIAILKQAWRIYVNRFWVLLGITLVPFALIGIFVAVVGGGAAVLGGVLLFKFAAFATTAVVVAVAVLAVLVYLAFIYIGIWAQAALLFAVKGAEQKIGFKESFRQASHKIGSLFGAAILVCAIVGGSVLLLVIVFGVLYALGNAFLPSAATYINFVLGFVSIVAIFLTVFTLGIRYSLATYIVVGDDVTAMSSVKRSRDYVRGYWWPVFWRLVFVVFVVFVFTFAIFLIVALVSFVLKGAGSAGAIVSSIVNLILSAAVAPLYGAYLYQVYANLKAVKGASQIPGDKRVSGWIFLAIVLALILVVAVPIGLLALNAARVKARDARRFLDAQQVEAALALYFNDKGTYPSDLSQLTPKYLGSVPVAPTPADGSCTADENQDVNQYHYTLVSPTDYTFAFCTGERSGRYAAGVHTMTEHGIDVIPSTNSSGMQTLTDANFTFQYPLTWQVTYTGNPSVNSGSCGDAWDGAAACVTLDPSTSGQNSAGAVEVFAFKTAQPTMAWCQSRPDIFSECAGSVVNGYEKVTASSPPGDLPQLQYAIVGGSNSLIVLQLINPAYQAEFEAIVSSAMPQ